MTIYPFRNGVSSTEQVAVFNAECRLIGTIEGQVLWDVPFADPSYAFRLPVYGSTTDSPIGPGVAPEAAFLPDTYATFRMTTIKKRDCFGFIIFADDTPDRLRGVYGFHPIADAAAVASSMGEVDAPNAA